MKEIVLRDYLEKSKSVIDLEERLAKEGIVFQSTLDYAKWLKDTWRSQTNIDFEALVQGPELSRLQVNEVTLAGKHYAIRGVAHGLGKKSKYGIGPQSIRIVKQDVEAELRDRIRTSMVKAGIAPEASKKQGLYCEEGLKEIFSLSYVTEIKDVTGTLSVPDVSSAKFLFSMARILAGAAVSRVKHSIFTPKIPQCSKVIIRALSEPQVQARILDVWKANELPQPFDLETEHLIQLDTNEATYRMFRTIGMATFSERSHYTAKELVAESRRNKLTHIHYWGGAAHASTIAYFLENGVTNAPFSNLERFRADKNKNRK
jgi:hypothetical protein